MMGRFDVLCADLSSVEDMGPFDLYIHVYLSIHSFTLTRKLCNCSPLSPRLKLDTPHFCIHQSALMAVQTPKHRTGKSNTSIIGEEMIDRYSYFMTFTMSNVYVFLALLSVTPPVRTVTSFLVWSQSTTPCELDLRSDALNGLQ